MKNNWDFPAFITQHKLYKLYFKNHDSITDYNEEKPNCSNNKCDKYFKRLMRDIEEAFEIKC